VAIDTPLMNLFSGTAPSRDCRSTRLWSPRYRIFLENRQLAAGTINGRLAAVRRLAYEAADAGLLSPELAAGIRRVKGAKKLGVRLGNWLTAEEARRFSQSPAPNTLKGKRDRAILAVLLGCGLRRRELADLDFTHPMKEDVKKKILSPPLAGTRAW
jgi:integrase